MKNIFMFSLLFIAAVCVIFAQTSGVIKELSGEVELKLAGSNAFVTAKAGDAVAQSTIVSTGFRSTAVIEIGCNKITVRPLTRLSLAEIQSSSGTETLNVNLQAGRVRVDVNPPAGTKASTTVQGPSATASVRGTSFEFDTINLKVNEGTVAFSGTSGPPAMVGAGGSSLIGTDATPVDPASIVTAGLLPAAPVGTPSSGTQTQTQTASSGDLGVTIEYP
jgi:hypothetical protein